MYKQLFLVAALCIAVYAANQDDDDVRVMKTELEEIKKDICDWQHGLIKDTEGKIAYKVKQASDRGRKSEECAKIAGRKFKEEVKTALHGGPRDVKKLVESTLRKLEGRKMSKPELEKLKKSGINEMKDKMQSTMTYTDAMAHSLGIEYALTANKC